VLCVDQHPDFRTISDFRERHLPAFLVLLKETVRLAQALGQVRLEHVAQDGSKILANASKHKAMSYERLGQTEERLGREIAEILQQAREMDAAEDARYGPAASGDELPGALRREVDFRQARRARIREAKAALEARAAAEAAAAQPPAAGQGAPVRLLTPTPLAQPAVPAVPPRLTVVPPAPAAEPVAPPSDPPAVLPAPKAQYCFTDPASRIMPSKDGFVQAYNGQAAVASSRQIIVACDVTDDCTDPRQLQPLADQVRQNTGRLPDEYSADSGYWSEDNVAYLEERGVDVYLPPPRPARRGQQEEAPPVAHTNPCKARMAAKLATPEAATRYSLRKETAEPVFGQFKDGRGLRRFRLRGLAKVRGEWALWCVTHNLRKLAGVLRDQRHAGSNAATACARSSPGTAPQTPWRAFLRVPTFVECRHAHVRVVARISQTGS
jgi:Transposase DDE domain